MNKRQKKKYLSICLRKALLKMKLTKKEILKLKKDIMFSVYFAVFIAQKAMENQYKSMPIFRQGERGNGEILESNIILPKDVTENIVNSKILNIKIDMR
jgi:hypothetical protein